MTWHQWHQEPVMSSRIGFPEVCAFSKLSLPHSSHWILFKIPFEPLDLVQEAADNIYDCRESYMNPRISRSFRMPKSTSQTRETPGDSRVLVVPIKGRNGVLGEIDIDSSRLSPFSLEDRETLEGAALIPPRYLDGRTFESHDPSTS